MKAITKRILLIALILVVAGTVLALAAWALGASTALYWDNGIRAADNRERQEIDMPLVPFQRIDLEADVANLTLRHGDDYHIQGFHHGVLTANVVGDTLHVQAFEPQRRSFFSFGFHRSQLGSDSLTITVPTYVELQSLNLHAGVGNISVTDLQFDRAHMIAGVGTIRVDVAMAQNLSLESGVGNVYFTGALSGVNSFQSGTGNVSLQIPGSRDDYSYSLQTGVGRISVNGQGQGSNAAHVASEPLGTIQAQSGVGNVNLDFRG